MKKIDLHSSSIDSMLPTVIPHLTTTTTQPKPHKPHTRVNWTNLRLPLGLAYCQKPLYGLLEVLDEDETPATSSSALWADSLRIAQSALYGLRGGYYTLP